MLLRIARHDLRCLSADRVAWILVVMLAGAVAYGVYNGSAWVRFQDETLAAAAQDEAQRLVALRRDAAAVDPDAPPPASWLDPRSPGVVAGSRGQRFAAAPPGPLAAMTIGQADLYPFYFKMTNRSKQTFITGDEIENPSNLMGGRFDLGFVIVYLFPLLILGLGYNLLSSEREQGTLAMTLSQPVRLRAVLLGKVLARASLVLTLAIGLALVGSLLAGVDLRGPNVPARLGLWIATVAAYGAFWFALALAVNALGLASATNAVALVSCWMILVVIAPALISVAVTSLHPVPSRIELIGAIREASTEASAEGSGLLARYYEDHPELMPTASAPLAADFLVKLQAVQKSVDATIEPVMGRYDEQLARQQSLVDRLRFLTPAVATQEALNDVSGTSLGRHKHFMAQVDEFHRAWQDFFIPRVMKRELFAPGDYDAIPTFHFREQPLSAIAPRVAGGLMGLAAPAVLLTLAGLVALRRFPMAGR
jgi:ABC-2 type transport system permease protein